MRKKRIIISIVVVICVLVGSFFIMRFGVVGRIYDAINKLVAENKAEGEGPEELKYETFLDKDGNEYVVEYRKVTVFDEEGNELELWENTAKKTIIYNNIYEGKIDKIEDNKIYFTVAKEIEFKGIGSEGIGSKLGKFTFKDVKDYQVVFDINTFDLESDSDFLNFSNGGSEEGSERFYSAGELEFLVGEYLRVQAFLNEDPHSGDSSKTLFFYLQ